MGMNSPLNTTSKYLRHQQQASQRASRENGDMSNGNMMSGHGEDLGEELAYHLVWIRTLSIWFQHAHWSTKGHTSYGDHLLYERIYNEITEELDVLAEKAVGFTGTRAVDTHMHSKLLAEMLCAYPSPSRADEATMIASAGLAIINDYIDTINETYKSLKDAGKMTMGLDDFFMALVNKLEGNMYLLKQRVQQTLSKTTTMS